jgi:glycosyltransferase involved in cell wall biosynthesis
MAMGLPVVSTSLGCEGLNVEDKFHLLVQDQPEQFAKAVLQLITDNTLRQTLRQNGRNLVEKEFDWQIIFQQAEQELVTNFTKWKETQRLNSEK